MGKDYGDYEDYEDYEEGSKVNIGRFIIGLGVGSLLVYCEERIDCRWMV